MVSSGVVLLFAALAQAVYGAPSCGCGSAFPAPIFASAPAPVFASAPAHAFASAPVFAPSAPIYSAPSFGYSCDPIVPALEEGCCPGPVVERKDVIHKPVHIPYSFSEPTFSKQCFQRPAGVDKKVIPSAFETAPVCETQETIVKVPTTDVQVQEQPLVRKTCTTSEYVIQIPIVETTCTSAPLCKKTVRTQDNVLTTVSKKTSCAKQVCTQNKIVQQPFTETVCQNLQGSVTKAGTKTVLKPEIIKSCTQLPPRKCLKPATGPGVFVDYGHGSTPYHGGAYDAGYYGAAPYVDAPAYYGAAPYVDAPAYYGAAPYVDAPAYYGAAPYAADVFPAPYVNAPSCSCSCVA